MSLPPQVKVRVWFALRVDQISRAWNYLRIAIFLLLLGGMLFEAYRSDHLHSYKWIFDLAVGIYMARLIGRWWKIRK